MSNKMIKTIHSVFIQASVLSLPLALSSCLGLDNKASKSFGGTSTRSLVTNTPDSVSVGYGRLLTDNPIIYSGDTTLDADINLNYYLNPTQQYIVNGQQLIGDCSSSDFVTVSNCYQAMLNEYSSPLTSSSGKWAFDANSDEFAQVQAFGHVKKITDRYLDDFSTYVPNVLTSYPSAVPETSLTNSYFWPQDTDLNSKTLDIYALCGLPDNAQFDASGFNLCFGYDSIYTNLKFVQDNTVIYHEMGHVLNYTMMNLRNNQNTIVDRSNLGGLHFFDELGAISEGVSDYASYYMNQRTHLMEWAFGRFANASRPMSESDPLHIDGVDTSPEGRLSYPAYLDYWHYDTTQPYEDIHFNGQIISHYMVALTEQIKSTCSMQTDDAQAVVMRILTETLAQLGDLSATGHEQNSTPVNYVNLNANHAFEWFRINNPINFRRFSQTWAKFMKYLLVDSSNNNLCTGGTFTTDDVEKLLDDYGLLLFDTYNEDGNGYTDDLTPAPGHSGAHTKISLSSRQKTKLIEKNYLILDPRLNAKDAYIFDRREDMLGVLTSLNSSGILQQSISEQIPSDLIYNNGNGQISPGEFLGILPNIYNNHTETMAGIQILANDWDHFKNDRPCNTWEDNFPTFTNGAASLTTGEGVAGGCDYVTRSNGDETEEDLYPVCFVQVNEASGTRWTTQADLISKINLDPKKCLGGEDNTKDCFIRAVKGADSAHYSKIDPKESWVNTLRDKDGAAQFHISNLIFLEVNPKTPPGTQFNCRLRARFVNCDDCYHDKDNDDDDYLDYEYAGGKPFKIINFKFGVVD